MLKFNKLAWPGYGAFAVRQIHFGQELSPRGLFPRASAVFLAEADGLEAQSFGCRHSQGQKLLFCLSPTMSVQFSSGGRSGFEEQRAKAISHIGAHRHFKHETRTFFGVQRHTCRDAVGHGGCYLLMRCSCFDVSFAVYSVEPPGVVSQCGKQRRSLSASLCFVPSPCWSWQHFNRGSSACLQERVCSVRVRSRGYFAADCSGRTGGGYRTSCIRLAMLPVSSRGLGRRSRCALLSSVPWVGGQPRLRDLVYVRADLWQDTVRERRN